jgi:3-hydroxy-4-methylanthranilate adenylyltransferase
VDLTEVEHMLAALPEVTGAVVVQDHAIEAYLMLAEGAGTAAVEQAITTRLAAYKRPRRLHVVDQLPRTATGKLVRDHAVLRDITPTQPASPPATAGAHASPQQAVPGTPAPKGSADDDR